MDAQSADLVTYFQHQKSPGPRPILWVGAGASAAAGYPTLAKLDELLREQMPGETRTGFDLIDAYISRYSKAHLTNFLETHLGAPKSFVALHGFLARLAGAGWFHAIFTTNYDELLEDALKHERTFFVPQILEQNFVLGGREGLHLLKLHGSRTDWKSCVLSAASYAQFKNSYPLLKNQLDLNLRHHPLFFIGCSMRDPRLLDWLRDLGPARDDLFGGRAVLTKADWGKLTGEERALYESARIQPVLVETHADIATLLGLLAKQLAPPKATDLI
jgi:hypothetical protein